MNYLIPYDIIPSFWRKFFSGAFNCIYHQLYFHFLVDGFLWGHTTSPISNLHGSLFK